MTDDLIRTDVARDPAVTEVTQVTTEPDAPRRRVSAMLLERVRTSPGQVVAIAFVLIAVIALLLYALWPKHSKPMVAAENPPTPERVAGEAEEHSQEGAVEISEQTAERIGVKTEAAVSGEIEDTIATTGKALVAPNGQAILGAKVEGRAVQISAEPGQHVKAGQVLVVVDSSRIADLRGQLLEAEARLKLAEQNKARTAIRLKKTLA